MTSFPSLVIHRDRFEPRGAFAEAQAVYLQPDTATVTRLHELIARERVGIVAHFYMDAELQGVLSARESPSIFISDSLVMADRAVEMARAGARRIVVLGVDFMSENARAMLDAAGFHDVPVYRAAEAPIGCSLAEAAESPAYGAWLNRASCTPRSLHVVYINTSLLTKARAHALVPTLTCTSSNVVRSVLQAFAQIPEASVWFGPDAYMGANLRSYFTRLSDLPDARVRAVHPGHDAASIRGLLDRFRFFEQGNCVVHHMFGADVAERVRREHADDYLTAHFEVPGEMFSLALEAQERGRGAVGSTSNILDFILARLREAIAGRQTAPLRFVLGTEAGMVTAIVRGVRQVLEQAPSGAPSVEIVFPVGADAVAATNDTSLPIIPGVAAGEGCSAAGGCATCKYMKLNSLDALMDLLARIGGEPPESLTSFHPRVYRETLAGRSVAEVGGEPILHMRAFGKTARLPDALVAQVLGRALPPA